MDSVKASVKAIDPNSPLGQVVIVLLKAAEVYVKSTASPFDDLALAIVERVLLNKVVLAQAANELANKNLAVTSVAPTT